MKLEEFNLFRSVADPVAEYYLRATYARLIDDGEEHEEALRKANNATVEMLDRMFAIAEQRFSTE